MAKPRRTARTELVCSDESPSTARRFVAHTLNDWDARFDKDDVLLLTSELVTNAVIHAPGAIVLNVELLQNRLRVAVVDHGPGRPVVQPPEDLSRPSGRGMVIVDSMSSAWGVDPLPGGAKSVWFELRI
jgi:anti-sigma regulatory factor (Ser/Thr protein kinase)